jgi:hypothetical protein
VALTGAALLWLPARAQAQERRSGGLVGSIDGVVDALGQAVKQGDKAEVRELDHALRDLIKALEHKEAQHHKHHHHKGGAIQNGMRQFTGQEDPLAGSGSSTAGSATGKGRGHFGRGVGQFGNQGMNNSRFGDGVSQALASASTPTTSGTQNTAAGTTTNGTTRTDTNRGLRTTSNNTAGTTTSTTATGTGAKARGTSTQTTTAKADGNAVSLAHKNAGHQQIANVGKAPTTAKVNVGAKKGSTAMTFQANHGGRGAGATVGRRLATSHVAASGKKR